MWQQESIWKPVRRARAPRDYAHRASTARPRGSPHSGGSKPSPTDRTSSSATWSRQPGATEERATHDKSQQTKASSQVCTSRASTLSLPWTTLRFMSLILSVTTRRRFRATSWVYGPWCLGATYLSAVDAIVMCAYGTLLLGMSCLESVHLQRLTLGHSYPQFTLRGHTSTVRCLKMSDANTAISGSRDTTLRIWDLKKGLCKHVLIGHQASVRCLEVHGDLVVSGSYDTTVKIWSISEGKCLRTLSGHFSQIYAIAFDGKKIATGSLDTSVRIWDPTDG